VLEFKVVEGELRDLVVKMSAPGKGVTKVRFLAATQATPYGVKCHHDNEEVDLFGHPARYVGIANHDEVNRGRFIVSDSFSPCVPVIALERGRCSLAHCNGIGGINQYSASWGKVDARVIVISKGKNEQQKKVASEVLKKLQKNGFASADMCELPTASCIGVIVRDDTILVYNQ